eukprot:5801516-Lingulodinium_polyedra.AAC.1
MALKPNACDVCPKHGQIQGSFQARQRMMTTTRPGACARYAPRALRTLECRAGALICDPVSR